MNTVSHKTEARGMPTMVGYNPGTPSVLPITGGSPGKDCYKERGPQRLLTAQLVRKRGSQPTDDFQQRKLI